MESFRQIMDIIGTSVDGVGVCIVVGGAPRASSRARRRELLRLVPAGCGPRDSSWPGISHRG
jgi:hypothetical protein